MIGYCIKVLTLLVYLFWVLRILISVVSQEPILFGCSITDNIKYGKQGQIETDAIVFYISVYIHQICLENVPVRQVYG